ncbi:MAG TPA: Ig-like domain repeat protein [Acidimicrobiales bacterium]|nr:Ig-like domain repeat protein [Acidimicrobiales bacterium]
MSRLTRPYRRGVRSAVAGVLSAATVAAGAALVAPPVGATPAGPAADWLRLSVAPAVVAYGEPVTVTATVVPLVRGAATPTGSVTFSVGGTSVASATLVPDGRRARATFTTSGLASGDNVVTAAYGGDTDSDAAATSTGVAVEVDPSPSSITETSSPDPSTAGAAVTLTATVTPRAGGAAPTGSVTFAQGATALGSAPLVGGAAVLSTTALVSGPVTATYGGDANVGPSSTRLRQKVAPAASAAPPAVPYATHTTLDASPNPSTFGQPVTLQVAVLSLASGSPGGAVDFMIGKKMIGGVHLSHGTATFTTTKIPAGTKTIRAVYKGTATFAGSVGKARQTVTPAATTVTLTAAPGTAIVGQGVTLTAHVSAPTGILNSSKNGKPVTFTADGTTIGRSGVKAGVATLVTGKLALGPHSLTATYKGGHGLSPATSVPASVRIDPGAVATNTSSPGLLLVDPVTLTTTFLSVHHPGSMAPPRSVVLSPDGRRAYAVIQTAATLTEVDLATGVPTQIPLGFSPGQAHGTVLAISRSGRRVYVGVSSVANPALDAVVVVSTIHKSVLSTIPLGGPPGGVAVTTHRLYVSYEDMYSSDHLLMLSTDTGGTRVDRVVGNEGLPGPVAVSGNTAYTPVTSAGQSTMEVVTVASNHSVTHTTFPLPSLPSAVAASPDGHTLYVAYPGGTVQAYATATDTLVGTTAVGGTPLGLAVSADGSTLFVAAGARVAIVNTATDAVSGVPANASGSVAAG